MLKRNAIVTAILTVLVAVFAAMPSQAALASPRGGETPVPALRADPTVDACRISIEAASDPGWFPDRYTQCRHRIMETTVYDANNVEVGTILADILVMGYAQNGARQIDYIVYVDDITKIGAPELNLEAVHIGMWIACGVSAGPCTDPPSAVRDDPVADWRAVDFFSTTMISPEIAGGGDQIDKERFDVMLSLTTPGQPFYSGLPGSIAYSDVRYDSASYVGRARGSVFMDYTLRFEVSLSNPAEDESALHIRHAVDFPMFTLPSYVGKSVPGEEEDGEWLTRMYNPTDNTANRSKSESLCRQYYGTWDPNLRNCDEYPFASTYQGSKTGPEQLWNGQQRFSVRLIDADDNQNVGRRLENEFYRALRVLDGDRFYIVVTQ